MNTQSLEIILGFITGLRPIVTAEVSQYPDFRVIREEDEGIYLAFPKELKDVSKLRSVSRAYIVSRDSKYNPAFIAKHKSYLGDILTLILAGNQKAFATFKLVCAGSDSPTVRSIVEYIQNTFKIKEAEEADLKVHIIKIGDTWEIGAQITPRPLSSRSYRVRNMGGAMDATIAYAVNSLASPKNADSYLNVFSGSATLLIEAAQCYPNLKKLIGFDNNKDTISLAIQNARKGEVMRRMRLTVKDIFDTPELGMFDIITSDLPFGMTISKNEDLGALYQCFIEYCQRSLNEKGTLVVYTSEHKLLKDLLVKSKFKIVDSLELKFMTSANVYLQPRIFVCQFK